MKRKSLRTLVCALLASLALTTFAFADSGPKPLLIVRVKDAPQEPYYLDLLAEGNWDASEGNSRLKQSTVITNSDGSETTVPLNEDLLALLLDNIPAGWHACTAQGTFGAPIFSHLFSRGTDASGNALHRFGYVGVPSTYRIILVTESGKVWVSDILNRRVLQSSVTVNCRTIRRQSPFPFPQPSPATCCNLSQRSCRRFSSRARCCFCSAIRGRKTGKRFYLSTF